MTGGEGERLAMRGKRRGDAPPHKTQVAIKDWMVRSKVGTSMGLAT